MNPVLVLVTAPLLALAHSSATVSSAACIDAAGPPILCTSFDPGGARVLSWRPGDPLPSSERGLAQLADEALDLLDKEGELLAHMETLRRAALALSKTPEVWRLLARLHMRVLDAEAAGRNAAARWFDAAFFSAALRESGIAGLDGAYAHSLRALELEPGNARMHLGAALAAASSREGQDEVEAHVKAALAHGSADDLVRRNAKTVGAHLLGKERCETLCAEPAKGTALR